MIISLQSCEPADVLRYIQQHHNILNNRQISSLYSNLISFVKAYITHYPICTVTNGCDYTFKKDAPMSTKYRVNMAKFMFNDVLTRVPLITGADLKRALKDDNQNNRLQKYVSQSGELYDTKECFHPINLHVIPIASIHNLEKKLVDSHIYCYDESNWSAIFNHIYDSNSILGTRLATVKDLSLFSKIIWFTYDLCECNLSVRNRQKVQIKPYTESNLKQAWVLHLLAYYLDCDHFDECVFSVKHEFQNPYFLIDDHDRTEIKNLLKAVRNLQMFYFKAQQDANINDDPKAFYQQLCRRVTATDSQVTDYFELATHVAWAYTHDFNKTSSFLTHQLKLAYNKCFATW